MSNYWAIFSRDSADAPTLRQTHLQDHLRYAENMLDRIAVGGPLREGDGPCLGSLIILKAESEPEARQILEADPYYRAGVWTNCEIMPFRAVIGDWIGGKVW